MVNKKTVLFISHEASRTGAPILLLTFLTWLKRHTEIPFEIILRQGGEITGDFEALAPVTLLSVQNAGRRGPLERLRGISPVGVEV